MERDESQMTLRPFCLETVGLSKNVKLSVKLPIVHLFLASWDDSRISRTRALTDVDTANVIQDIVRPDRSKIQRKKIQQLLVVVRL